MPAVTTVQGNYFLANNETLALAANLSNVNVFGYVGGVSELDLQSSDSNITVNANVSRIGFSDALSAYTFQAQGNTVNVYLQSSGSLVANIDVGTNGSLLSFGGTGFGPTATQPLALRVVPASGSALLQITLDGQPLSNAGAISIGSAPTPPTSPTTPPVSPTMALTVAGDTVNLSGTTAASTVALTGADLTAFPSATFGTVAQLVGVGITSVTNSGGNFMLNASGNLNATTFNFGTGVVSGADAASSTGITYLGVTTYVAGNAADNVTGAASGNFAVNLGALTYTGTVAFGASGNDTIKVSGNSNISGATITSGGASVGLVFNAAGTETLNTAQYNLFNATSITGGTFGGNTIAFSNAGTVSDNINVGNYHLSSAGNTISLNNAGDTVTGAATGGDNYKILSTSFTGSLHLGSSGADTVTIDLTANHTISGGSISSGGTSANLVLSGSGTLTVSSAEAATFHASNSAIVASGTDTMNIGDASSIVNLNAHENALNTVGLQAAFSNVNISIGAASVNAGAAGFNQSVTESALTGHDTFNINNGSATITGAVDATHYVTINGFNTSSDQMVLTLSGVNQNGTSQTISDSGNDVITAGNNGLIYLSNLGALLGYVVANANDLSSAETNILAAVDATTASTGVYTFAIDTNNGAALYQTHFTGSTLDGIQLVGVVSGTAVFSMIGHIS